MLRFFDAVVNGRVPTDVTDTLCDLRAVLFYKDETRTKLRPICIGECLRRIICRCIAQQDRTVWDEFFTSMLPEVDPISGHLTPSTAPW